MVVTFVALVFGYLFALGITRPIRGLVRIHSRHEPRGIS